MLRFLVLGTIELRHEDGHEAGGLSQSKPLGLLAYLALAKPRGYHRRDVLSALFWPELDAVRSRAALSRALYQIRGALGSEVVIARGDEAVGLDFSRLECDALLLEDAYEQQRWRDAARLYRGELLYGLHVANAAPELDHWIEQRRAEVLRLAASATWRVVEDAEERGDMHEASEGARRYLAMRPSEESSLRDVMQLFDRAGDKAAVAGVYDEFVRRMEAELELQPSPETRQLLARIRSRSAELPLPVAPKRRSPPQPVDALMPPQQVTASTARPGWQRPVTIGVALGALAVAFGIAASRSDPRPTIALSEIRSDLPADSVRAFETLLTINLGRIRGIDVVSERRMTEIRIARPDSPPDHVAQRAGASQIVDGVLSRSGSTLRLDVTRADLRSGRQRGSYAIEGRSLHELADLLAERVAKDLGLDAPAQRRDAATTSLIAYRLYELGLRSYYQGDHGASLRYFNEAVREDSLFAMAWLFAGLATNGLGMDPLMQRAVRLSEQSPDQERLFIRGRWAAHMQEPRLRSYADSLIARYPNDPEGYALLSASHRVAGNTMEAIASLERLLALDSANIGGAGRCRACDALEGLTSMTLSLGDLAGSERYLRIWQRYQPTQPRVWYTAEHIAQSRKDWAAVHAAVDSQIKYSADGLTSISHTGAWYYTDDFELIDKAWRDHERSSKPSVREGALWTRVIASRTQGRMRDALAAAREYRRLVGGQNKEPHSHVHEARLEAVTLLDMGRAREAAALYDSSAMYQRAMERSRLGAQRASMWMLASSAHAAAGNITRLRALEDSVRIEGALSVERKHRLWHHYVIGVRLAAEGKHAESIPHFRAAIDGRGGQYVRMYLDLARSLLAAGRPAEAIAPLQTALAGPMSAAGLYATRTDLLQLLGDAYARAGEPDSAAVQYRRVLKAWREADPELAGRVTQVKLALARLDEAR